MALTSYTGTEIGLNGSSGTFDAWRTKTNDIIGDLSTVVVTVSSSATVANNTNGSQTTGNMDIDGYLSASDVVVWGTIRGGSNYTWATSATLAIDSAVTANGNIDVTGDVTATTFSGSGASLTSIPAGQLTGTVASARLTGTYAIDISGTAATATSATSATTATGATNIDIDATTSTDITTYPVLVGANTTGNQVPFIDNADLSYNASTGALSAVSFVGDGSSLTALNATQLTSGTVPAARLSEASAANIRSGAANVLVTPAEVQNALAVVTLTDTGGTLDFDWDTFINGTYTMSANTTLPIPTNPVEGETRRIEFNQDGTGGWFIHYASGYEFVNKFKPTITTDANAKFIVYVFCANSSSFVVSTQDNVGVPA